MSTFARTITGTTLIFASLFNAQLSWNADRFYNEPDAFEARVVEMHTTLDTATGQPRYFKEAKEANMDNLSRFFGMVK